VVIVGAGPYGLSLGAHLSASGVAYRIFGTPMAFWSKIAKAAPERFLKSFAFGTDISAPVTRAGFSEWCSDRGYEAFEPCAMAHFAEYGMWFQRKFVTNLETCRVNHICREGNGFQIGLSNGETLVCDCVVIATGLEYFEKIPEVFSELPLKLVRHSNSIEDYQTFSGLEVAVVGAGQSALEAAALVREAGGIPHSHRSRACHQLDEPGTDAPPLVATLTLSAIRVGCWSKGMGVNELPVRMPVAFGACAD
jgi:cation diffusion facilitator CzcD-associated flavoprotein CzcO